VEKFKSLFTISIFKFSLFFSLYEKFSLILNYVAVRFMKWFNTLLKFCLKSECFITSPLSLNLLIMRLCWFLLWWLKTSTLQLPLSWENHLKHFMIIYHNKPTAIVSLYPRPCRASTDYDSKYMHIKNYRIIATVRITMTVFYHL